MAAHKIFQSSGNLFPQKITYLNMTEFADVHMLISSKNSFSQNRNSWRKVKSKEHNKQKSEQNLKKTNQQK